MDLQAQGGPASRSRALALAAWTLAAGLLGAGTARADIEVHVMNCSGTSIGVETYDAKDHQQSIPYSKTTVQSKATATLKCEGQGKGYCHTYIAMSPDQCAGSVTSGSAVISGGDLEFNLDSGKWAVVTGGEIVKGSCTPVVQENLASAPAKCN
jgi:hypothetical protein